MRSRPEPQAISRTARAGRQPGVGGATTVSDVDLPRGRGAGVTPCRAGWIVLAASAALALAAGCNPYVQGNGVYAEETRDRPAFQGLRIADGVAAFVTVSPGGPQSLKVLGDSNVIPHVQTEVEPTVVGTAVVPVLHVWVSEDYDSTIGPTVVVAVPSFRAVEARDGSAVQVSRAAGASFTGEPIDVTLATAALDASAYPVEGASVSLSGTGVAKLRSSGPVVGTAAGEMQLVNYGTGRCDVAISGHATLICE